MSQYMITGVLVIGGVKEPVLTFCKNYIMANSLQSQFKLLGFQGVQLNEVHENDSFNRDLPALLKEQAT